MDGSGGGEAHRAVDLVVALEQRDRGDARSSSSRQFSPSQDSASPWLSDSGISTPRVGGVDGRSGRVLESPVPGHGSEASDRARPTGSCPRCDRFPGYRRRRRGHGPASTVRAEDTDDSTPRADRHGAQRRHRPTRRRPRPASWSASSPSRSARLVRNEARLAQAEVTQKAKRLGVGAGLFGGAGLFAFFGLAALVTTAILALALVLPAWLAALIVAVVLFAVAGVLALVGKKDVEKASPPLPTETIAERAGRHRHREAGARPVSGQRPERAGRRRPRPTIKAEIDATREQLGRTVDELSARLDVPARARESAARAQGHRRRDLPGEPAGSSSVRASPWWDWWSVW